MRIIQAIKQWIGRRSHPWAMVDAREWASKQLEEREAACDQAFRDLQKVLDDTHREVAELRIAAVSAESRHAATIQEQKDAFHTERRQLKEEIAELISSGKVKDLEIKELGLVVQHNIERETARMAIQVRRSVEATAGTQKLRSNLDVNDRA